MKMVLSLLIVLFGSQVFAGGGAVRCLQKLGNAGAFIFESDAMKLCAGASSTAPADCYIQLASYGIEMSVGDAATLCRGAKSTAPARCVYDAIVSGIQTSADNLVQLCR